VNRGNQVTGGRHYIPGGKPGGRTTGGKQTGGKQTRGGTKYGRPMGNKRAVKEQVVSRRVWKKNNKVCETRLIQGERRLIFEGEKDVNEEKQGNFFVVVLSRRFFIR